MAHCPTCNLAWELNPPVKCAGSNHFRCVECKAVYSGEMLAAGDLLAAATFMVANIGTVSHQRYMDAIGRLESAIAKAEGKETE